MYEVKVYPERNHLFVKIGSMGPDEPRALLLELFDAVEQLQPGWSVITDLSEALTEDPSHGELLGPAMRRMIDAGLGQGDPGRRQRQDDADALGESLGRRGRLFGRGRRHDRTGRGGPGRLASAGLRAGRKTWSTSRTAGTRARYRSPTGS